jgi:DNA-binding NarL/FixJ family response regulator
MIRVIIADDQELVRAGFRMILEHNGIDVVAEAADGLEAVARTRESTPDIVLMDIRMPTLDGIEATRRVTALPQSTTRVLILTTFDLDEYVYEAVRAGASGFLLKDVAPQDLVHAVTVVARGDAMLAPAVTRRLLEQFVRRPPHPRNPTGRQKPHRTRTIGHPTRRTRTLQHRDRREAAPQRGNDQDLPLADPRQTQPSRPRPTRRPRLRMRPRRTRPTHLTMRCNTDDRILYNGKLM